MRDLACVLTKYWLDWIVRWLWRLQRTMKTKGTLSSFYPHWWEIVCVDVKVFWVPLTVTRQTGKPPSWEDLYNITEVAVSRFPAFVISSAGRLWWEIHQMLELSAKLNILFSTIWVSQLRRVQLDVLFKNLFQFYLLSGNIICYTDLLLRNF